MTTKTDLTEAHEEMASVLDAKFGKMPEWKAFRAIDRALLAQAAEASAGAANGAGQVHWRVRRRERIGVQPSYMSLADKALTETGKPISTMSLVAYISKHRPLSGEPDKAKIVIQSSLSKDKRFRSVPWEGKRAWWFADRPVPK